MQTSELTKQGRRVYEIDADAFDNLIASIYIRFDNLEKMLLAKAKSENYADFPEWLTTKQLRHVIGIKNWTTIKQWEERGVLIANGADGHYKRYSKESALQFTERKAAWERGELKPSLNQKKKKIAQPG